MTCICKHSGAAFAAALAAALDAPAAVLARFALTALRADSSLRREIQG